MSYYLICKNNTCKEFNIRQNVGTFRMAYDAKAHKMVPKTEFKCSNCGCVMEFEEVAEGETIPEFSVNTFGGQPDEKKKEILRHRFDKEIKRGAGDEKEMRKRKAMGKMLGYDK